jgi:predicted DNA-binding protein YlxM (UPF0122 family)
MNQEEQAQRLLEMQRLYEVEQLTVRQIADHFGVSWQAIHERLVRAGVPLRQKSPVKRFLERETLIDLYTINNLTIGEIAQRLKTNYEKVSEELDRHGIKKRSKGYFNRRYTELELLKCGENVVIKRPTVDACSFRDNRQRRTRIIESNGNG